MHIDIEDTLDKRRCNNSGLFMHLSDGGRQHLFVIIHVAPRLKPEAELAVMNQQQLRTTAIDDKGAGGDVTRLKMVGGQRLFDAGDETERRSNGVGFLGRRIVRLQQCVETGEVGVQGARRTR